MVIRDNDARFKEILPDRQNRTNGIHDRHLKIHKRCEMSVHTRGLEVRGSSLTFALCKV